MTLVGCACRSGTVHLRSPWHHLTGWMRTACCSGGDLTVTRAASPRSAWVKRTEQVRGEKRTTHVVTSPLPAWAGGRAGGKPRWSRRVYCGDHALILYAADVGCVVKRASCPLLSCTPCCWALNVKLRDLSHNESVFILRHATHGTTW